VPRIEFVPSERILQKNFVRKLGNYKSESMGKLKFTYEESGLQSKGLMLKIYTPRDVIDSLPFNQELRELYTCRVGE